jgi:hypothetical protein
MVAGLKGDPACGVEECQLGEPWGPASPTLVPGEQWG